MVLRISVYRGAGESQFCVIESSIFHITVVTSNNDGYLPDLHGHLPHRGISQAGRLPGNLRMNQNMHSD